MMFKRKEMFHVPEDNITFDNRPNCLEAGFIRVFHWMSRVFTQWGGPFNTWNPIVIVIAFVLYQLDIIWSGLDKQYYVKRRALYGPNFISATSIVMSKYDEDASEPDAIDTRFLTIPQRRGFFLGSTAMTIAHLPKDRRPGKETRNVSLLHVSDRGVKELKEGELDHDHIRDSAMLNFLGDDKMQQIKARAENDTTKALLVDFAEQAKGLSDGAKLAPIVERFLIKYFHYVLFNLPADEVPVDLLQETFYKGLRYVLYLFGPKWLPNFLLRPLVRPSGLEKKLNLVKEYYTASPVFDEFVDHPSGDNALSKDGLLEMLEMLIGIAALQGTKALAIACMTQMPEGHAARAATANPEALRKAVLEIARLDAPVTGAHCIVDDPNGITTKIGNKTLKFPRGTVIFSAMTLANTDSKRFKCPYVFDADREGMPENLTSFNSIGERTGPSPRICPGRNVAVNCVCQMLKAKLDTEKG